MARMKATTVKLEGEVLMALEAVKPAEQSVTAFVREAVHREIRRRTMARAAVDYRDFLAGSNPERADADAWEAADLASPPRRRRR